MATPTGSEAPNTTATFAARLPFRSIMPSAWSAPDGAKG